MHVFVTKTKENLFVVTEVLISFHQTVLKCYSVHPVQADQGDQAKIYRVWVQIQVQVQSVLRTEPVMDLMKKTWKWTPQRSPLMVTKLLMDLMKISWKWTSCMDLVKKSRKWTIQMLMKSK